MLYKYIFNSIDFYVYFKTILLFLVLLNALITTELSVCTGNSALVVSLTLSVHALEGYSSHFVCLSVSG